MKLIAEHALRQDNALLGQCEGRLGTLLYITVAASADLQNTLETTKELQCLWSARK